MHTTLLWPLTAGYLLIAQPQSSSTATMHELAHMAGKPAKQVLTHCSDKKNRPTCSNSTRSPQQRELPCEYAASSPFHRLGLGHSDVCELTPAIINDFVRNSTAIFKQHLAPSQHHLQLLLKAARRSPSKRVLLLTRSVLGSAHAVCERAIYPDLGRRGGRRLAGIDPALVSSLLAWQRGWLAAARNAKDVIWTFSYEQMERYGRDVVLSDALHVLGLKRVAGFGNGSDARLVNRSDPVCDVGTLDSPSSRNASTYTLRGTVGFDPMKTHKKHSQPTAEQAEQERRAVPKELG